MSTRQRSAPSATNPLVPSVILLSALIVCGGVASAADNGLSKQAQLQIESLLSEKTARSETQLKLDSQLIYAISQRSKGLASPSAPLLRPGVELAPDGSVLVDITAVIGDELIDAILKAGGIIDNAHAEFDAVRARLPLAAVEGLAAREEVRFIEPAVTAITNTGSVTSEGDVTHRAAAMRTAFSLTGTGVNVGVLSDSSDFLASSQASNDLGAVTVLAGQSGVNTCGSTGTGPCTGEGTAILEILADVAPNAALFFATGNGGPANMAANIQALQTAGCNIIVDDLTYSNEPPFQDGPIAQAVNTVSAAGAMYFSSARNSGNLNDGTSGTWEGDFVDGGAVGTPLPGSGRVHSFGASTFDAITAVSGASNRADLFWSDPQGASNNDYDLFVLDAAGNNVLQSSTNAQTGSQNPYERVNNALAVGNRIVIVQRSGAAARFLHLDTGRDRVTIGTAGNVRGHNASGAANAFSVAATNVANSNPNPFSGGATNPVETFSSDGPRRIFYNPTGTALTPGNVSSTGGQVLNKPDITAADGVTTSLGGFNPFFGTSAAAPHAAAIAALLLSSTSPVFSLTQIRNALQGTALDIEAVGFDRDSGFGIVMAFAAYKSLNPCTLTCPGNIAKDSAPNTCGATATFTAATSGGCGTVTCAPPSGSLFPVGTTPDQCTSASEDSCSFLVTVTDVQPPSITCPSNVTVECTGDDGTPASNPALAPFFTGVSATDNCAIATITNNAPVFFGLGTTPVIFTAKDVNGKTASCQASVTVADTIPPVIGVTLSRTVLWPPNHKLVDIAAAVTVTDICDPHPTFVLTSIVSNEPDNGTGDGDTANDIQNAAYGTADTRFSLRSERSGGGHGRVYSIVYTASDHSGNKTPATVQVTVPHDQSGHALAGNGFNAYGTAFSPKTKSFELTVTSSRDFDATLATSLQVGNSTGTIDAQSVRAVDVNGDGLPDLVASFSVAAASQLRSKSASDDSLAFRYLDDRKDGFLVDNIFALGSPLSASAVAKE